MNQTTSYFKVLLSIMIAQFVSQVFINTKLGFLLSAVLKLSFYLNDLLHFLLSYSLLVLNIYSQSMHRLHTLPMYLETHISQYRLPLEQYYLKVRAQYIIITCKILYLTHKINCKIPIYSYLGKSFLMASLFNLSSCAFAVN